MTGGVVRDGLSKVIPDHTVSISRFVTKLEREKTMTDIAALGLRLRTLKPLRADGIETIEQLLQLSERQFRTMPGFGRASFDELRAALAKHGFPLPEPYHRRPASQTADRRFQP